MEFITVNSLAYINFLYLNFFIEGFEVKRKC